METGTSVTFRLQLLEICNAIVVLKQERRQKRYEFIQKYEDILKRHEEVVSRKYSRLGLRRVIPCKYIHRRNVLPYMEEDITMQHEQIVENSVKRKTNTRNSMQRKSNIDGPKNDEEEKSTVGDNNGTDNEHMPKQDFECAKASRASGKSKVTFASDGSYSLVDDRTSGKVEVCAKEKHGVSKAHTEVKKKTSEEIMKQMTNEEISKYLDEVASKVFRESQYNKYSYMSRERNTLHRGRSNTSNTGQNPKPAMRQTLPRLAVARRQNSNNYQREPTSLFSSKRHKSFIKLCNIDTTNQVWP